MNSSIRRILPFVLAVTIVAVSFSFIYAQKSGPAKIEGSYKVVLKLPKATPTAILTFCSKGEPFAGAWVEDDGEKFVGEMYNQKINGNEYVFTVKAGPGIWDFVCTSDGKTLKGTVTGDGATSGFEGPKVTLKKEYCTK